MNIYNSVQIITHNKMDKSGSSENTGWRKPQSTVV